MENISMIMKFGIPVLGGIVILAFIRWILSLRVVVPTNMVHIVQKRNNSVPYGRGKDAGNVYYSFPSWIPFIGVMVTQFQESIFQINLKNYDSYDSARLPFVIDVSAFFKVANAETVAQRVASFAELQNQLESILQGSVRRILATTKLEDIMQERSSLGDKFTEEVQAQIKEWGVESVKTIEFMDLRDASGSNVIANIMSKEKSRIEKESRVAIANNTQEAETQEIEANRLVQMNRLTAEKQIGISNAEKEQQVGIANEQSKQMVLDQQISTTEKNMEVSRVSLVKQAEINKDVAIVDAQKEQQQVQINSQAELFKAQQNAQAVILEGEAKAKAEQLMLEAPVEAQIKLAREIGTNEPYQKYLITIEQIKVEGDVRKANAVALEKADLKLLVNSGEVQSGINKLTDLLSSKGGQAVNGFLSGLDKSSADSLSGFISSLVNKPSSLAEKTD